MRLCLLHGICDLAYLNEYVATSTEQPTTTPSSTAATTTTTTTTSAPPRSSRAQKRHRALLQLQIERCIQTPRHCNTNMVVTEQTRSAAARAREGDRSDRELDHDGLMSSLFEIISNTTPKPTKGESWWLIYGTI